MQEFNSDKLVSLEGIVDIAKKYDKTEVATLSDGFDIGYYPYFSYKKITNVMNNLNHFLSYNATNDKESLDFVEFIAKDETEESFTLLIYFFTILEFTHIGSDLEPKKKPKELFPYFESLVKTGYLIEIIDEVLFSDEVAKVIKEVSKISSLNESMNLLGEEFTRQLAEQEDAIKRLQTFQSGVSPKQKEAGTDG